MVKMYNNKSSDIQTSSTQKNEFDKRFNNMKSKAEIFKSSWRDLSQYLNPKRGRFDGEKFEEQGQMIDHKKILSSYATQSLRKSASGLNSGITSKSRPWFRLTLDDENLSALPSVRMWLDYVQEQMYAILRASNIYGVFQNTYEELLTFGTGCFIMVEDFETVIRCRNFTAGEYFLGVNDRGKINSFARSFNMTVGQLVEKFGIENCPDTVKSDWEQNYRDQEYTVRHLIEPNDTMNELFADYKGKPYRSAYWIQGQDDEQFLAMRGFKRFPVIAPRWMVPTTDVIYGFGPGWEALGDVKELQKVKSDKLLAQEKLHNPPMQSDANVDGFPNLLPGGVTKTSANTPNAGVTPVYQINPNLESFIELTNDCKQSIDRHFFTDLFSMLAVLDRGEMTAREVSAREQERFMLMGPILNQLDEEMLSKVIELLYGVMDDNGLLPPPPKEIEGRELRVQYVSILAQMQESSQNMSIAKVAGFVAELTGVWEGAKDILNIDESVREFARQEGIPEKLLNDPALVQAIREQQAQMQQAQMAMGAGESMAGTAKDLSQAKLGEGSVLDNVKENIGA